MQSPLELLDVMLVVRDLAIKGILLSTVGGLQLLHLLAVGLPQTGDLLEQVGDLSILERNLRIEDL
jgi:hypothetical protein